MDMNVIFLMERKVKKTKSNFVCNIFIKNSYKSINRYIVDENHQQLI